MRWKSEVSFLLHRRFLQKIKGLDSKIKAFLKMLYPR